MDTSQLQAFDQIVRYGTFSKAARSLDISQPTISLRIQALEKEVGGRLFVRGGSRLELTEMGKSFLPFARQALTTLTAGVETAQLVALGKRGQVWVGTLPTLATGFFTSALTRLHASHPELDLIVHTGHNQQIVDMLYEGYVKIGLMTWPFFIPDLTVLHHIREPLLPVANANHPLTRRGSITLEELRREAEPFYLIDWSPEVKLWQSQFLAEESQRFEVPPQSARDLLLRGNGAALLTQSFVEDDLAAGRLVQLDVSDLPRLWRESVLVCHGPEEKLPPAVRVFLRVLVEEMVRVEQE